MPQQEVNLCLSRKKKDRIFVQNLFAGFLLQNLIKTGGRQKANKNHLKAENAYKKNQRECPECDRSGGGERAM